MKFHRLAALTVILPPLLAQLAIPGLSQSNQTVSVSGQSFVSPVGGGGGSGQPIISRDGNFVVFASLADNLVPAINFAPPPASLSPNMQVFLRNWTNATTSLVSLNLTGTGGGNGGSFPSEISADGRFILYESAASDLVNGDANNASDIFLRDLAGATNLLASANTNGVPGNGFSRNPAMSADGRYIAFVSAASDLVAGDTNGITDIFVRDLQTGVTTLASPGAVSTNLTASSGGSDFPEITPDGRYVVFSSTATNLVAGGQTVGDIYVRDLVGGITTLVSADGRAAALAALGTTNINCYGHRISADGQFVAYEACPVSTNPFVSGVVLRFSLQSGLTDIINTNATGVTPDYGEIRSLDMTPDGRFVAFIANTNGAPGLTTCVCLWDANSGATTLVGADLSGGIQTNTLCSSPTLDATGRFLLFLSNATNLTASPATADFHLYRWDQVAGTNQLVDIDLNGTGSVGLSPATFVTVSANGNFVAFEAPDGNLVPADSNRDLDVFVRDLGNQATEIISAHDPALPSLTANRPSLLSVSCISTNSRYVAFVSEASNLVPNDTNGCRDIFVRDLVGGSNILVSVPSNGVAGANNISADPTMTPDGRYVAFTSFATNLVPGAVNKTGDIYVRDLVAGTTTLVSISRTGVGSGNGASRTPSISADGNWVLFQSLAANLVSSVLSSGENLFLRNMQSATNYALNANIVGNSVSAAAMTPDGRFIAFGAGNSIYLWNSQTATKTTVTNTPTLPSAITISPDGTKLAYSLASQIRAVDLVTHSNWVVSSGTGTAISVNRLGLRFSGDGRFLAFASTAAQAGKADVYLYDFQTRSNTLVSQAYASSAPGNGASDSPDISPDGRFIAYRSQATNLVPGDNNAAGDLFLFDRLSGATSLISVSRFGNVTANHWSINAFFSGDSQTLFFQSWASDLVPGDFNHQGDIFALSLGNGTNSPPPFTGRLISLAPPTLSWPASPGHGYGVQFKDNLTDPTWQNLNGNVTVVGTQGSASDFSPGPNQRFYRIISF